MNGLDPGSAYLGALVTLALVLALLVAGAAFVVAWCHRQAGAFVSRFRTMRLERVGGQVQVTAAVVERELELDRELAAKPRELPSVTNGAPS